MSVEHGIVVFMVLVMFSVHEWLSERRHNEIKLLLNLLATFIGEQKD